MEKEKEALTEKQVWATLEFSIPIRHTRLSFMNAKFSETGSFYLGLVGLKFRSECPVRAAEAELRHQSTLLR